MNRHYFTDTSVSQRIRITVCHNTASLFNIYWRIFSALSTERGGSENQAAHKIFLTNNNDNWQCKINKNVGNSAGFFFSFWCYQMSFTAEKQKGHIIHKTACKLMVKDTWIQSPRARPVPVISCTKGNLWPHRKSHRSLWNSSGGAFGLGGSGLGICMTNYFFLGRYPT